MKLKIGIAALLFLYFFVGLVFAEQPVQCKMVWRNQSVEAGSYVETQAIALSPYAYNSKVSTLWRVRSGGILSLQPEVTEGTFTFTVYFSNFPDASVWDSGTDIATGIAPSDTDRITIDPDGVALWMKIRATETSGTGSPSLSAVLCSD